MINRKIFSKLGPWYLDVQQLTDAARRAVRSAEAEVFVSHTVKKFVPNSGLGKFRLGKSIVSSTELIDGRVCGSQLRRSTRRVWTHVVYYSVCCGFVVDLLYNLFLQLCNS